MLAGPESSWRLRAQVCPAGDIPQGLVANEAVKIFATTQSQTRRKTLPVPLGMWTSASEGRGLALIKTLSALGWVGACGRSDGQAESILNISFPRAHPCFWPPFRSSVHRCRHPRRPSHAEAIYQMVEQADPGVANGPAKPSRGHQTGRTIVALCNRKAQQPWLEMALTPVCLSACKRAVMKRNRESRCSACNWPQPRRSGETRKSSRASPVPPRRPLTLSPSHPRRVLACRS